MILRHLAPIWQRPRPTRSSARYYDNKRAAFAHAPNKTNKRLRFKFMRVRSPEQFRARLGDERLTARQPASQRHQLIEFYVKQLTASRARSDDARAREIARQAHATSAGWSAASAKLLKFTFVECARCDGVTRRRAHGRRSADLRAQSAALAGSTFDAVRRGARARADRAYV